MAKKSAPKKKEKLKDVNPAALGGGDMYAYGVRGMIEQMKNEQGSSQTQWLGVSKQSFDAKDCVDREKLHCKGKK